MDIAEVEMRYLKSYVVLTVLVLCLMSIAVGLAQESVNDLLPIETVRPYYEQVIALQDAKADAEAYFLSLPDDVRLSLEHYMMLIPAEPIITTSHESSEGVSLFSSGCLITEVHVPYNDAFGLGLFAYKQKIDWCYDGTNLIQVIRSRWGEVYRSHYYFDGHVGDSESGGLGQSSYFAMTQGKFHYQWLSFYEEAYPRIEQWVYGNGNHSGNGWH